MFFRILIRFAPIGLLACALFFTACDGKLTRGDGPTITEIRNEKDFHALEIECSGEVEVRVDSVFKIEVTCEESIIGYLRTEVQNGVLEIYFDRPVWDVDGLKIRVSAPTWDAFEVEGSASIDVLDAIAGENLKLGTTGSGDIKVADLDFKNVNACISGSGDMSLSGVADDLDLSTSGSGDFDALGCAAKTAKVKISGSGDAAVNVSDTLSVHISGSGDVSYKGSPTVDVSISGSGTVRKI